MIFNEERHLMPHHVHMLISIPLKYSWRRLSGIGRKELDLDWQNVEMKLRNFLGHKFEKTGVSTIARNEEMIRASF
jgi:putative transposase